MAIILPANTLSAGGFSVANSCRFNKANSPYLYKTQSAGNRDKWSFSLWVKIGAKDGILHYVLGAKSDASNYTNIEGGDGANLIRFGNLIGGGYDTFKKRVLLASKASSANSSYGSFQLIATAASPQILQ